jgi:hypothetical protein
MHVNLSHPEKQQQAGPSMSSRKKQVTARYRRIDRISPAEVLKMYAIFQRYYENADLDTFLRDMSKKTGVFLLHRRSDREIVGFSTVAKMDLVIDGKPIKGVFSGDTIIERDYWGSRALPLAFFLYLVRVVLRHPLTPVFWLLISKGYKTYLLLANNFFRFYPHPDSRYQQYQPIIPQYCERLFPGYYDAKRGILDFGHDYQRLKADVAPINDDVRRASQAAAFFEACNPEWHRGTELPCVGRVGFTDAARYPFRYLAKLLRRTPVTTASQQAGPAPQQRQDEPVERIAVPVQVKSRGKGSRAGRQIGVVARSGR